MDIVVVPTFARPEYLALCLEHLAQADGISDKLVFVYHDKHFNDSPIVASEIELTQRVVSIFAPRFKELHLQVRSPHAYIGNPYNFLEAYKDAYTKSSHGDFIYLVEDDVLVAPDFFRWHEAVQARGNYFCTVGWHCIRNAEVLKSQDASAYIESTRDFSSIGVCWRRENLMPLIGHARVDYYRSMAVYLRQAFPGSPIPSGQWTEQAGVITRLLHQTKDRWVAWPSLARCAHVGIQGYHRPQGHRFTGNLEQRIAGLRHAIATNSLNSLSKDPFDDVAALDHIPSWQPEDLHVVQRFPYIEGRIV